MDPATIAQFVRDLVSRTPGFIRGSSLGSAVQVQFPSVSLKLQYGGLRRFIDEHCSDTVEWRAKQGGDDVFAQRGRAVTLPSSDHAMNESVHPNVWKIFSNPSVDGFLLYHPSSRRIFRSPNSVPGSELIAISRFTHEEQKQLIAEFVAAKLPQHSVVCKAALDSHDYWGRWFTLMNTLDGGIHRAAWLTTRASHLQQLFESRLRAIDLGEDEIVACKQQLGRQPEIYLPHTEPKAGSPTAREIAARAIAQMSDEQLRAMTFPLGVILDAFSEGKIAGDPGQIGN